MAAWSLAFAAAIHPPVPVRATAAPPRAPLRPPPRIRLPSLWHASACTVGYGHAPPRWPLCHPPPCTAHRPHDLGSPSSFLQVRAIVRAALARKWASLTPSPGYCLPAARSLFRFARRSDVVKASDGMRPSPERSRGRRCDAIGIFYIPRNRKVKKNPGVLPLRPPVQHATSL
ncbi:hypothetical protein PVAP13_7NG336272 [Panicum virgatum]|uniref:Uncharacterized protein n=1 Tax=Panicum virgatum TaxID=38727 RepID=A0A8T0Q4J3_PANVG|nr:hypothetical protein PVAP13_7NG336272 [Panicum virgatum]